VRRAVIDRSVSPTDRPCRERCHHGL